MAEKVDPQKHCASVADAKQRLSCEVLVQECNAQQDANASTFTLAGADNRKRTYRSLTACHKAAVALPKELGPLPASRLPAATSQPTAPDYASCGIAGAPGTPKNHACRAMIDLCSSSTHSPIILSTDRGDYSASTPESCRSMAAGLADSGHTLVQPPPKPSPQTTTTQQGNSATQAQQPGQQPQDATALYGACSIAGPAGSSKHQACRVLVEGCASASNGAYTIRTDHGNFTTAQQDTCVSMASGLADRGYLPEGYSSPPPQSTPHDASSRAQGTASQQPTPNLPVVPPPATPVAGPRQVKPFADIASMRLRVTGEGMVEQRLLLLFGAIHGVPVRFRYSLTRVQGDQFRMRYSITVQDDTAPLGGEQTIDFSAPGNRINLGFELSLWNEGNYKPIRGIRVVSLG